MSVPQWLLELNQHDELLVYFPYTGNYVWAEFIKRDSMMGEYHIQYVWKNKVKYDILNYDNYSIETSGQDNWFAYRVN